MNDMPDHPASDAPLSDRDLVLQFESLGDNCELGLVQRKVGAEPLGLFRFAGAPLRHVLRAMDARFAGMADPEYVRLQPENGEFMVRLTKYDFIYHADVKIGEAEPEALHRQQVRTVGFLVGKLIADLEAAEKIVVFRQNEPLSAIDLVDLRIALAKFGPNTLLWVTEACAGHPPGSVDAIDQRFMVGYVPRLAARDNVPDFDPVPWMTVLRRAWTLYAAHRTATPAGEAPQIGPAPAANRIDVVFGRDGNAGNHAGFGWSAPEDGFMWSVDDRSQLLIDAPPAASDYWLEMDVVPFVAPPAAPHQTLVVTINGTQVHRFNPLDRGIVGCTVPGHLIRGQPKVDMLLEHPHAASPSQVSGEQDDRRLAIAFRRLSLIRADMG
jgi:hypothetical protein